MSVKGVAKTEGPITPPKAEGISRRISMVALGAIALGLGVLGILPSHLPLQAALKQTIAISIPLVGVGGCLVIQSFLDKDWNVAKVALAALVITVGVLGIVNPTGLSDFAFKHLTNKYVALPLIIAGGSLILYTTADFGFSRRGSKNFAKASLARRIDHLLHVPMHALRSYWVRNQKIGTGPANPDSGPSWYQRGKISGPQVADYATNGLAKAYFFTYFYPRKGQNALPEPQQMPIIMDFVLEGAEDHIIAVKVDQKANTIEYYDSMGLTINDRAGTRVRHMGVAIEKLIKDIADKYKTTKPFSIHENRRRDQFDQHSCGVMISLRKCAWLNGISEDKRIADSRNEMEYRRHMLELMGMPVDGEHSSAYVDDAGDDF